MLNNKSESVVVVLSDDQTWDVDGRVLVFSESLITEHHGDEVIGCNTYDLLQEGDVDMINDECITEAITIVELLEFYRTAKRMGLERIIKDVQ
jgi:hypothetical protein